MPQSLGARLRRQREQQKISLASIAEQTKIHQPLLEELERDQVTHWPSGIFRRAFVRTYAEAIGLQPDDVVREFLTLHPEPVEVVAIGTSSATESVLRFLRRLVGRYDPPAAPIDTPAAVAATRDGLEGIHEAGRLLDNAGMVVWAWSDAVNALTPTLSAGYSDRVRAQLPKVPRDADNATAAAFRSETMCAVPGLEGGASALVAPLMVSGECVGVLAVELPHGAETNASMRAAVSLLAKQLGRLADLTRVPREDRYERSARRRA